MSNQKTILVAPVDWGLGHATRCIPIIQNLLNNNYKVIIASSRDALTLLQKEFPQLESISLPSYNIRYPKNGRFFKYAMIKKLRSLRRTIKEEETITATIIHNKQIDGIISDGRLGVRHPDIPSVFVTHQLQVDTGSTTFISSKLHQHFIKKFDHCWVPDYRPKAMNLTGKLGHVDGLSIPITYIGPLSRMEKKELPITIDILVLISGPEPQRTMLEDVLRKELKKTDKRIVIIQGIMESEQKWSSDGSIKTVNFVLSDELETLLNQSDTVIARSGYTTIMDLAHLEKKALLIPTPGQFEQRYLAGRMEWNGMAPFTLQRKFALRSLKKVAVYQGLHLMPIEPVDFKTVFEIFEG